MCVGVAGGAVSLTHSLTHSVSQAGDERTREVEVGRRMDGGVGGRGSGGEARERGGGEAASKLGLNMV